MDDVVTMEELERIDLMLSLKENDGSKCSLKSMGTQTESAMMAVDSVPDQVDRHRDGPKVEVSSIGVQVGCHSDGDSVSNVDGDGDGDDDDGECTKMGAVIKRLSAELRGKGTECEMLKEECCRSALEVTASKKEALALRVELNECRQQMEDQQVYGWNLQKYLDDKSRNEAVLRQQVMAQQQRMEQMVAAAHSHSHSQRQSASMSMEESREIESLRELLMASEQKCSDWRRKWKEQCFKMERLESDRMAAEQGVSRQIEEYHQMVEGLRAMMSCNLNDVHQNVQRLNAEKMALKKENERLLIELGAVQETAILQRETAKQHKERREREHEMAVIEEDEVVIMTADKAVQCGEEGVWSAINDDDDKRRERESQIYGLSQQIYDLMLSLKSNAFEIGNEYGVGFGFEVGMKPDLDHKATDRKHQKRRELEFQQNHGVEDTDDVDRGDITLHSKHTLNETKVVLQSLLKWLDDVMYRHAERQCDQCITQ